MDGLAHLLERPSLLGLGEVTSGTNDVSRGDRGFFEAAVQVTEMPPLPLNRSSVVEEAFLLLDPIRQSV
jgi:hypothetical protein